MVGGVGLAQRGHPRQREAQRVGSVVVAGTCLYRTIILRDASRGGTRARAMETAMARARATAYLNRGRTALGGHSRQMCHFPGTPSPKT